MLPFFAWKIFSISFFISLDFYLQVLFKAFFAGFPPGGRCRAQAKRMRGGYINETHNISFESNRFSNCEGLRTTQKREVYFAPASI